MAVYNANQLKNFALEISDREIYNDIRAECDVTEILTVRPDATPEFFDSFTVGNGEYGIEKEATFNLIIAAPSEHSEIVWLDIVDYSASPVTLFGWGQGACEELGGEWRDGDSPMCLLPSSLAKVTLKIITRGTNSCTVRVENKSDYAIGIWVDVSYIALTPETRYIKLRSTNVASIAKYGRRAFNLTWPLGITPVAMQSLIDNYCARYCEPVSLASMTLEGNTDAKITQILNMRIDDKHQIIHPGLSMDEEFFVNNVSGLFSREGTGLLTGTFSLEQVRAMENLTLFIIGTSLIGGAHVIAP